MSSRKWSLTAGERRRISEKEPVLTRLSGLHRAKHQYRSSQNSFTITPGQNDRDIPLSSYYPTPKRRAAVQSVHTSVKVLAALVATQTYLLSQQDCLTFSPETNQLQHIYALCSQSALTDISTNKTHIQTRSHFRPGRAKGTEPLGFHQQLDGSIIHRVLQWRGLLGLRVRMRRGAVLAPTCLPHYSETMTVQWEEERGC